MSCILVATLCYCHPTLQIDLRQPSNKTNHFIKLQVWKQLQQIVTFLLCTTNKTFILVKIYTPIEVPGNHTFLALFDDTWLLSVTMF
jgi:hypothetical protein